MEKPSQEFSATVLVMLAGGQDVVADFVRIVLLICGVKWGSVPWWDEL